jgi:hypothetical protein
VADSLKVLDLKRPIREADVAGRRSKTRHAKRRCCGSSNNLLSRWLE